MVGNLTKLCSKGMMKKKQESIFEEKLILWGVWRVVAYEYSFFIFFSFFYQNNQWKCSSVFHENAVFFLAQTLTTWKHFNCFQQNMGIIFN